MNKKDLQKMALTLYNKGMCNPHQVECSGEMWESTQAELDRCIEYIDELIRIGKRLYKNKYNLKPVIK